MKNRYYSAAFLKNIPTLFCMAVMVLSVLFNQASASAVGLAVPDCNQFSKREYKTCSIDDILYSDDSCPADGSQGGSSGSGSGSGGSTAADPDGWTFPTAAGTPISSDYKAPDRPGHRGVDLSNSNGTPIYASRDGTVVNAGPASGFGNWIVIQHEENGQRVDSVYGHMYDDGVLVRVGDKVTAGQEIGKMGSAGQSSGPHLHYEEWPGGRNSGGDRKPVAVYGGAAVAPSQPSSPNNSVSNNNQGSTQDPAQNCSGAASSGGTTCDQSQAGASNDKIIWDHLIKNGLTPQQAAGVMGNLRQESGPNLDPGINEVVPSNAGAGYGIAQWTGARRTALEKAAKDKGVPVNDLCFQLDYLVEESKSRKSKDDPNTSEWDGLKKQSSINDATDYWHENFERSADKNTATRQKYAREYMDKYGGGSRV